MPPNLKVEVVSYPNLPIPTVPLIGFNYRYRTLTFCQLILQTEI